MTRLSRGELKLINKALITRYCTPGVDESEAKNIEDLIDKIIKLIKGKHESNLRKSKGKIPNQVSDNS